MLWCHVTRRELNSWGVTPKEEGSRCGPGPIAGAVARQMWPLSAEPAQASPETSHKMAVTLSQLQTSLASPVKQEKRGHVTNSSSLICLPMLPGDKAVFRIKSDSVYWGIFCYFANHQEKQGHISLCAVCFRDKIKWFRGYIFLQD